MAKEEWGTKRICLNVSCGAKFYDLLQTPIICPACGEEFKIETPETPKPGAEREAEKASPKKDTAAAVDDGDELLEDDDGDVGLDDDDVLDDSDDDTVPLEDIANVTTDDES